ncbi:TetR/AcrR family transcriptional regulator [Actinokineospora fastidiosa]|uniref:TetR family transcriptional regulator n=1 Tax=Actinokineospora fastidiosa TaxID=1816 RepID=A0A918GI60_9PSEU|nr:TetR/AcrR family transcriptional regulator [Actinokineospora fastidiosa]GGS36416.1 TetR family transcriptional regulator [Actinokineospora fastidiosa]
MAPRKAAVLRHDERSLREHLIATAERMIAAQGAAGLTVRAIAREAGVADGVLYNHFADKEELLAAALRAHVDSVERNLPALPEPGTGTVEENLRAHLDHGLALHRAILPAFTGLIGTPAVLARFAGLGDQDGDWRSRLVAYLRAERELGRLPGPATVDAAAALLVGLCHEVVLSTMFPHAAASEVSPDAVVTAILHGIA